MNILPTDLWNINGLFFQNMNNAYTGILVSIIKQPYPRIEYLINRCQYQRPVIILANFRTRFDRTSDYWNNDDEKRSSDV